MCTLAISGLSFFVSWSLVGGSFLLLTFTTLLCWKNGNENVNNGCTSHGGMGLGPPLTLVSGWGEEEVDESSRGESFLRLMSMAETSLSDALSCGVKR